MNRRVVITGMGAVTPIGIGVDDFWQGLLEGRNGVGPITLFDASDYPTKIAAEVKDFDSGQYLDRKNANSMSRCVQFGSVAAALCMANAQWQENGAHDRLAVIGAISNSAQDTLEYVIETLRDKGPKMLSPRAVSMVMPHTAATQVGAATGFENEITTITNACAAGLYAIGHGAELIRAGKYDAVLCPSTEASITYATIGAFGRAGLLSLNNDCPEKASRPFDARRDGGVLGEGAGCILLEDLQHARLRETKIFAEVFGFGVSGPQSDAQRDPSIAGMVASMRKSLAAANLSPRNIDYISASGVSDPDLDRQETEALKALFGEDIYRIPVSSIKGHIGVALNAGGALQLISSVMALNNGILPPTLNYVHFDPECDLDYVPNVPRYNRISRILVNAHGMHDSNSALVVGNMIGR